MPPPATLPQIAWGDAFIRLMSLRRLSGPDPSAPAQQEPELGKAKRKKGQTMEDARQSVGESEQETPVSVFESRAAPFRPGLFRVAYGGHVYAQAAWAAAQTVPKGLRISTISGHFLQGGNERFPLHHVVRNTRTGTTYAFRTVEVKQTGLGICFTAIVAFKREENVGANKENRKRKEDWGGAMANGNNGNESGSDNGSDWGHQPSYSPFHRYAEVLTVPTDSTRERQANQTYPQTTTVPPNRTLIPPETLPLAPIIDRPGWHADMAAGDIDEHVFAGVDARKIVALAPEMEDSGSGGLNSHAFGSKKSYGQGGTGGERGSGRGNFDPFNDPSAEHVEQVARAHPDRYRVLQYYRFLGLPSAEAEEAAFAANASGSAADSNTSAGAGENEDEQEDSSAEITPSASINNSTTSSSSSDTAAGDPSSNPRATFLRPSPPLSRAQVAALRAADTAGAFTNLYICAHLYHSDRNSLFASAWALGGGEAVSRIRGLASLSHTVVIHGGVEEVGMIDWGDDNDDNQKGEKEGERGCQPRPKWFLLESGSSYSGGNRCLFEGRLWGMEGQLVATMMQDGLMRLASEEKL